MPELPFGWVEMHDLVSGRPYYFHLPDNKISYTRPRRPLPPEPLQQDEADQTSASPQASSASGRARRLDTLERPASFLAMPGISSTLSRTDAWSHNTAPRQAPVTMQTTVSSASSNASSSSGAVRTPPPAYSPETTNLQHGSPAYRAAATRPPVNSNINDIRTNSIAVQTSPTLNNWPRGPLPSVPVAGPPPLPPVPAGLRESVISSRNAPPRSASANLPSPLRAEGGHRPIRSQTDPTPQRSSQPPNSPSPFLAMPGTPYSAQHFNPTAPYTDLRGHVQTTGARPSSARSDNSASSGATHNLYEPDDASIYQHIIPEPADPRARISPRVRPANIVLPVDNGALSERPRRPYSMIGVSPTITSESRSPGDNSGTDARRTGSSRTSSSIPSGSTRHSGLTPSIDALDSDSDSSGTAAPRRQLRRRSTPYRRGSAGPAPRRQTFDPLAELAEELDDISLDDEGTQVEAGDDRSNIRASLRSERSRNRLAHDQASTLVDDLSNSLDETSLRSEKLLNSVWKVKLRKANRKIEELQDKLSDLGRADARLERELKKEMEELNDLKLAKLDKNIMRELKKLSNIEFLRLKKDIDRDMTIDELKRRLSEYESVEYDSDSFDPQPIRSRSATRSRRRGRNHPPSFFVSRDYTSDNDMDLPTTRSLLASMASLRRSERDRLRNHASPAPLRSSISSARPRSAMYSPSIHMADDPFAPDDLASTAYFSDDDVKMFQTPTLHDEPLYRCPMSLQDDDKMFQTPTMGYERMHCVPGGLGEYNGLDIPGHRQYSTHNLPTSFTSGLARPDLWGRNRKRVLFADELCRTHL